MRRKTLVAWQVVGQVEFAVFAFFAVFALAMGLSGMLDEAGHRSRWYQSVGLALVVLAFGLPGLAVDFFTRGALRRCPPDEEMKRGFEPVIRSED